LVLFVRFPVPQVRSVVPGSPGEAVGLMEGDTIVRMNGTKINIYEDLEFEKSTNQDKPARLEVLRGGERITLMLTPRLEKGQYNIGFYMDERAGLFASDPDGIKRAGIGESIQNAFFRIFFYIKVTFVSLARLITFQLPMSDMAGPIGMVSLISNTYTAIVNYEPTLIDRIKSVVENMTLLCAILSANLGVFNLLPLPALDGGRLVFVLFEAIRKKPIPADKEGFVHFVGIILLMILAVVIAYSDIRKLI
jgi:regulator of sigma E protease